MGSLFSAAFAADPAWQPTLWNGEKALASVHEGCKAIVSLVRGRLVHFSTDAELGDRNLLFATSTRDDPAGWGGHRLWLGPQSTWAKIWPPPDAWEHRGPDSFTVDGDVLRMLMPDAGDRWPRLTRTYHWQGRQLVCGAEIRGGRRPAQIIQIVQVPNASRVKVTAHGSPAATQGYALLPGGSITKLTTSFAAPASVTRDLDQLILKQVLYTGAGPYKLGFWPQTLLGCRATQPVVIVSRGTQTGRVDGEPDQGFSSQVYLGIEPFIESEQLTPLFSPDVPASFEIAIEGGEKTPGK